MDSDELEVVDRSSEDTSSEHSLYSDSTDIDDLFGEPLVDPRVGRDYQAEIPPMLTDYEHLQLMRNPADPGVQQDVSHSFLIGKPVPVMWVYKKADIIEGESIKLNKNAKKDADSEFATKSENFPNKKAEYSMIVLEDQKHGRRNVFPVPGFHSEPWNDFEVDCFILGLYIFGKNLLQVKEFMVGKEMGQILAFYYGQFYRSSAYCRWSDRRKKRIKKSIIGYKLFSGCRLQELFSRLAPGLSEEHKTSLFEISKSFAEGRASLEDYVSSLKAVVGIEALVEKIGIGKANDLTNLVVETSKTSHMFSVHAEVPFGKACSSLSTSDVIKFLTGDFRLSKARSQDLFWEAVWPRLLDKGWHSEVPKNEGYTSAKDCLVFVMPGIKKFSRRKLVKGDQYFDCVSDVLKKIASKPELLEPDAEEPGAGCGTKAENGWAPEMNSLDSYNSSDAESPRYLQPRVSVGIASLLKFMVVDTSIDHEEQSSNIRELRTLPVEFKQSSFLTCLTKGTTVDLPANKVVEPDTMNVLANSLLKSISANNPKGLSNESFGSDNKKQVGFHRDPGTPLEVGQQTKDVKHQFSRRAKTSWVNPTPPIQKRRKLTSCNMGDTRNFQIIAPAKLDGTCCILALPARTNTAFHKAIHSRKIVPSVTSCIPDENTRHKQSSSPRREDAGKFPHDCFVKPEVPEVPDLNFPQVPTESKAAVQMKTEPTEHQGVGQWKPEGSDVNANLKGPRQKNEDGSYQEHPTAGGRRQSTRNRPLSFKAWEALEVGWTNPKPSKKRKQQTWLQEQSKRPSRRLHVEGNASYNFSGEATDSEEKMSEYITDDAVTRNSVVQTDGDTGGVADQASGHP